MSKFRVTLVTRGSRSGMIEEERVGDYESVVVAMKAAKKAAGRGAKFRRKGIDMLYAGPKGSAYIV